MNVLRTTKKLILGETWILPGGLCVALAVTLVVRQLLDDDWRHVGGFVLLVTVAAALVISIVRSAKAR